MLDFPENEGDSRKLKKIEEVAQHFSEQCRHYYLPKEDVTKSFCCKFEI